MKVIAFEKNNIKFKRCTKCKTDKPITEFNKKRNRKDGHNEFCKKCIKEARENWKYTKTINYRCNKLLRHAQERAKKKGLEFNLTVEIIEQKLNEFCRDNHHVWEARHPFLPSLDRIDSQKGYTIDNTRIVWLIENLAKSNFTEEQLLEFCKRKLNLI